MTLSLIVAIVTVLTIFVVVILIVFSFDFFTAVDKAAASVVGRVESNDPIGALKGVRFD